MNKEALFYKEEEGKIHCNLCPHNCTILEGNIGVCNVRQAMKDDNGNLKLYTLNYGEITSIAMDPIEKKPLYNFYPGSQILSIGSFGCNFKCSFCQNYSISQYRSESKYVSPENIIQISMSTKDNIGLAFTYNEPSIWYEYVLDVAKKIKELNPDHKTVLVTNGYINEEPLRNLLVYIDALNIDLKGGDDYYKKLCFGRLENVKNTIKIAYEMGCHIEVTTLLVPGENTDEETIKG
ncbi:MAG: radical SAM protein, partial [Clostridium sp.]